MHGLQKQGNRSRLLDRLRPKQNNPSPQVLFCFRSAMKSPLILSLLAGLVSARSAAPSDQAAAPDFGPNVRIFDPSMTTIQGEIDAVFARQESSQFGPDRVAYFFKPGKYHLDVQVGFYMQVVGL